MCCKQLCTDDPVNNPRSRVLSREFQALLFSLIVATFSLGAFPDNSPSPNLPPEPKNDAGGVPYWGAVTALDKDSITVQFPAKGVKPRRFPVSETLAMGNVPKVPRPIPGRRQAYLLVGSDMYRLTDVKVGDLIVIMYSQIDGHSICDHIRIQKRPGGLVPPLPDEAEWLLRPKPLPPGFPQNPYIPYHECMNAYWDLKDKGIPYPEKFGPNRRFPMAPMPRAASERKPIN